MNCFLEILLFVKLITVILTLYYKNLFSWNTSKLSTREKLLNENKDEIIERIPCNQTTFAVIKPCNQTSIPHFITIAKSSITGINLNINIHTINTYLFIILKNFQNFYINKIHYESKYKFYTKSKMYLIKIHKKAFRLMPSSQVKKQVERIMANRFSKY